MHFEPNLPYHVYNRGNDKQQIFYTEANYIFFLQKIKPEWKIYCEILCYCLMPNHFHFILIPNEAGCKNITLSGKVTHMQNLSKAIGKTLSSYTKVLNIQKKTTGNLFQKKTKAKLLTGDSSINTRFTKHDYLLTCFHYIHQNPQRAGLADNLKDWSYSSYPDYYGYRNGQLCNKEIALHILALSENDFKRGHIHELEDEVIDGIF
jgi:putative transposase